MVSSWQMLAAAVMVVACSDRPVGDDESTTASSGTGGAPTTSTDGAASTTGGAAESSEVTSTGGASTGGASNSSGCGETTGVPGGADCPDECSLAAAVCGLEIGEFKDCGTVDLDDDAAAWQAVHDCVLAAVSEQQTFVAIAQHFAHDTVSFQAFVGQAGCSYAITVVTFFEDNCGGRMCGPAVVQEACEGLALDTNCIGMPDEVCLRCDTPLEFVNVCG